MPRCKRLLLGTTIFLASVGFIVGEAHSQVVVANPAAADIDSARSGDEDAAVSLQEQLDNALEDYNAAIEQEVEVLVKECERMFQLATEKGDISLAVKCRECEKTLREDGQVPRDSFLKLPREKGQRNIVRASKKMQAAYESIAKSMLKEGKLDEAQAVMAESKELLSDAGSWKPQSHTAAVLKQKPVSPAFGRKDLVVGDAVTNSLGMRLVLIPAGRFVMGQVEVEITRPFFMGATEVTQGQWMALMGNLPKNGDGWKQGVNNAASCISWDAASSFCTKLTALERAQRKLGPNESYRLPTEAEWQYACRAGTTTNYFFGDELPKLDEYAWWGGVRYDKDGVALDGVGTAKGEPYAHEVGLKKPNPWGLYDMYGNVWEWCGDWYAEAYSGGLDPTGPAARNVSMTLRQLRNEFSVAG